MIKSEIRLITVDSSSKVLKVQLKCCLMLFISYDPSTLTPEQRPYYECEDFWLMLDKLCKKHKLQDYAPTPSLESEYGLFDVLEHFFDVQYSK